MLFGQAAPGVPPNSYMSSGGKKSGITSHSSSMAERPTLLILTPIPTELFNHNFVIATALPCSYKSDAAQPAPCNPIKQDSFRGHQIQLIYDTTMTGREAYWSTVALIYSDYSTINSRWLVNSQKSSTAYTGPNYYTCTMKPKPFTRALSWIFFYLLITFPGNVRKVYIKCITPKKSGCLNSDAIKCKRFITAD